MHEQLQAHPTPGPLTSRLDLTLWLLFKAHLLAFTPLSMYLCALPSSLLSVRPFTKLLFQ